MDSKELRDRLQLILGADLGKFGNGKPAIWIGEQVPPGTVNGLQCVIQAVPEARSAIPDLSGKRVLIDRYWQIILIDFSTAGTIASAMQRIRDRIERPVRGEVYIPSTLKTYAQIRFQIHDPHATTLR